jgi:hypothetical protein
MFRHRSTGFRARGAVAATLAALATAAAAQSPPREVSTTELAKYWLVASASPTADAPHNGKGLDQPTCAALRYVIRADGTTSDIVLEKLVPESALGTVAVSFVKSLRYAPGPSNKSLNPVSTRLVLPLNLPPLKGDEAQRAQIQARRNAVVAACAPDVAKPAVAAPAAPKPAADKR